MSDSISLSQELINSLLQSIAQHDPNAQQDMMVNIQYLVAVAGYLSADYPGPANERDELLDHLHAFMKHVCDDRANSKQQPAQQQTAQAATPDLPAGKSVATDDPAVGIWKPE
ncbi:MAG: hypothetical protein PVG20_09995 [Thioalkalispiraceae bacterium]|jgi:hypothetical protein